MNEVDFSKVGLKMKQLRSERGITQEQVAKDLNCTVPFVSNVENNRAGSGRKQGDGKSTTSG